MFKSKERETSTREKKLSYFFCHYQNEELFVIHAFTLISYIWIYIIIDYTFLMKTKRKGNARKKMEWKPETVEYNAVDDKIRK